MIRLSGEREQLNGGNWRELLSGHENCFQLDCSTIPYLWGLASSDQTMIACEKHFHQVWAGEN